MRLRVVDVETETRDLAFRRRRVLPHVAGGTVPGGYRRVMPSEPATDVLAQLADLPGVANAADGARSAVDALLWDRSIRPVATELARQSILRGAWASAAMDGADVPYEALVSGAIEASPMGDRTARTLALTAEVPQLVEVYRRSPLQAWARMNTVMAAGAAPEHEVGRPRPDSDVEDPLRLGAIPLAMDASQRLTALAQLVTTQTTAPALVAAGVVHGELAVLRPFRHASGPVARATIRLSLAARGLDPDLLTVPEAGLLAAGRPKYVRALRDYASGSAEGMAAWLVWFATAIEAGAEQSRRLAAEL